MAKHIRKAAQETAEAADAVELAAKELVELIRDFRADRKVAFNFRWNPPGFDIGLPPPRK